MRGLRQDDELTVAVRQLAEEVEQIEPLLVTYNKQGQIEGVKYKQIATVLVNAVRELQAQIDSLKKIVCQDHPDRNFCKPSK